mmetsp:Transcript_45173/g.61652  ORF Transcript_45173/g.61652 Transcript_45173/m.61652 type:complete len:118 (-) Transcript_45173:322-675(-)
MPYLVPYLLCGTWDSTFGWLLCLVPRYLMSSGMSLRDGCIPLGSSPFSDVFRSLTMLGEAERSSVSSLDTDPSDISTTSQGAKLAAAVTCPSHTRTCVMFELLKQAIDSAFVHSRDK